MNDKRIRFIFVGVINTILNILIFNVFIVVFHFSISAANIVSVVISICISFILNSRYVFYAHKPLDQQRAFVKFLIATLVTQIIVQQLVLLVFIKWFVGPGNFVFSLSHNLPLFSLFSHQFYIANVAKVSAIGASLVLNFILYDKVVFADQQTGAE